MEFKHLILGACLALPGLANSASTVFVPDFAVGSGEDINNFDLTLGSNGYSLYMFDNDASDLVTAYSSENALEWLTGSRIEFTSQTSGFEATDTNSSTNPANDSIFLTNDRKFILAVTNDNGNSWVADTAVSPVGGDPNTADSYTVTFGASGVSLVVDVNVVEGETVNPGGVVPIPAAVWLFGSGLLGLVGIARRRHH